MKSLKSFGKPRSRKFNGSSFLPGLLLIRRIAGESMLPSLPPGRVVIGRVHFKTLGAGDIVIIAHDGLEKIKRIAEIRGDRLFLLGDNAEKSTDSRVFGWLPVAAVRAKVVWPRSAEK